MPRLIIFYITLRIFPATGTISLYPVKTGMSFLAGLVAVALAQATPLDLPQKSGVQPNQLLIPTVSACGSYTRPALHRTIIDDIDQPLIAIREEQGHCIATSVPPHGFFAVEEAVDDFGTPLEPEDRALLEGSALLGLLLLATAYATNKLRPSRHRHAVAKRRPGSRRHMAVI